MSDTLKLPPGWQLASFRDLGEWSGGGTPSKSNAAFWENGTIPWVSPKDMKVDVISGAIDHITEAALERSAAKLIVPGSILFVTRSGILAHTFPVALTSLPVTVNQDLKALTPTAPLHSAYLAWAARAFGSRILEKCSKDGTTVASVDTALLHAFLLPIAPLPEQHRIVEAIESYSTRLDDAVASLERVQRNLKRYRASVLKSAVEGRLVPTEAELARTEGRDYEPASVLLERILAERRLRWEDAELAKMEAKGKPPKNDKWKAKYTEPVDPDTSLLPDTPEGWCWVSVDQLLAQPLANGRSVKTAAKGFPVLRLTSLREGIIALRERKIGAWTVEDAERFLVQGGDFLVSRGNGSIRLVGLGGLVRSDPDPVAYPDTMIRFRLCGGVEPRFFAQVWNSRTVRNQLEAKAKTTAGIFKVNQGDLATCVVPLPPMEEQLRIQREIERLTSEGKAATEVSNRSVSRCARLRQAILKWAFEGKLVNQNASEEPATVLLERIKTERETAPVKKSKARTRRKARSTRP